MDQITIPWGLLSCFLLTRFAGRKHAGSKCYLVIGDVRHHNRLTLFMSTNSTPPPLPDTNTLEKLRTGQRLIILGILFNLLTIPFRIAGPDTILLIIGGLVGLTAIVVSIVGLLRMASGLGIHIAWRILLCIVMIIPLLNLVTLLILNSRATRRLTDSGYKVGLLGANKK